MGKKQFIDLITKHKTYLNFYNNKPILDILETNDYINTMLKNKKPFMAGSLGVVELLIMLDCENNNKFIKRKNKKRICNNAGFFVRKEEDYYFFAELMRESCNYVDILGVGSNYMEDYIAEKYCSNNVIYAKPQGFEPWYIEKEPWSGLLEGKKVLFIHPFEETILKQAAIREKIDPQFI